MADTSEHVVEQVRSRYAAAALSVQTGEPAKDYGCGAGECNCAGGCCGDSATTAGGAGAAVAQEGFGVIL